MFRNKMLTTQSLHGTQPLIKFVMT